MIIRLARQSTLRFLYAANRVNILGGRLKFIRVRPSDERTLVVPDFYGNCVMAILGDIEAMPLLLSLISLATGDILLLPVGPNNVQKYIFLQGRATTSRHGIHVCV